MLFVDARMIVEAVIVVVLVAAFVVLTCRTRGGDGQ